MVEGYRAGAGGVAEVFPVAGARVEEKRWENQLRLGLRELHGVRVSAAGPPETGVGPGRGADSILFFGINAQILNFIEISFFLSPEGIYALQIRLNLDR